MSSLVTEMFYFSNVALTCLILQEHPSTLGKLSLAQIGLISLLKLIFFLQALTQGQTQRLFYTLFYFQALNLIFYVYQKH